MPPAANSVSHSFRVNPDELKEGGQRWNGRWTNSCPVAQAIIRTFNVDPEHVRVTKDIVHVRGFYLKETPEQMSKWIQEYDFWCGKIGPKPENTRLSITLSKIIPEDKPATDLAKDKYVLAN